MGRKKVFGKTAKRLGSIREANSRNQRAPADPASIRKEMIDEGCVVRPSRKYQ